MWCFCFFIRRAAQFISRALAAIIFGVCIGGVFVEIACQVAQTNINQTPYITENDFELFILLPPPFKYKDWKPAQSVLLFLRMS